MTPDALRLIAENEQDMAECEKWWREATTENKLQVLFHITRKYDDPAMEIMSRMAQITYGQLVEKDARK